MTTVALLCPTMVEPRVALTGPLASDAAIASTELGHSVFAQARNGHPLAALRHPGDNWQDRSRQASPVTDAILADPAWKGHIAAKAPGFGLAAFPQRQAVELDTFFNPSLP